MELAFSGASGGHSLGDRGKGEEAHLPDIVRIGTFSEEVLRLSSLMTRLFSRISYNQSLVLAPEKTPDFLNSIAMRIERVFDNNVFIVPREGLNTLHLQSSDPSRSQLLRFASDMIYPLGVVIDDKMKGHATLLPIKIQGQTVCNLCYLGDNIRENYVHLQYLQQVIQMIVSRLVDMYFRGILEEEKDVMNFKLHRELYLDGLTHIPNRKAADLIKMQYLEAHEEVSRGCAMLDIDNFKNINDTYGHPAGDAILIEFAHLCVRTMKDHFEIAENDWANDIIGLSSKINFCRYGGEEFVFLTSCLTEEQLVEFIEIVREKVSHTPFSIIDQSGHPVILNVTVSAGLSSTSDMLVVPMKLIESADMALYVSKRTGKNKTSVFSEEVVSYLHTEEGTSNSVDRRRGSRARKQNISDRLE